MSEFLQSGWAKETRCSLLGGRRAFCINPFVRRLGSDRQIADQCLYLQREHQRGKTGCPFHRKAKEVDVRNEILVSNFE